MRLSGFAAHSARFLLFTFRPSCSVLGITQTEIPSFGHSNPIGSQCWLSTTTPAGRKKPFGTPGRQPAMKNQLVDEDDDDAGLPVADYRTMEFTSLNKRIDHVLAVVTGKSRMSLEKQILQGSVRVNEEVVTKKAYEVNEAASLELFVEPIEDNDKLAIVQRVEVLECPFDEQQGYQFRVHHWKQYFTDNWKKKRPPPGKEEDEEEEED